MDQAEGRLCCEGTLLFLCICERDLAINALQAFRPCWCHKQPVAACCKSCDAVGSVRLQDHDVGHCALADRAEHGER